MNIFYSWIGEHVVLIAHISRLPVTPTLLFPQMSYLQVAEQSLQHQDDDSALP